MRTFLFWLSAAGVAVAVNVALAKLGPTIFKLICD